MNTYNKVIFVCMGNTCRSPMAATIMKHELEKCGLDHIAVESRGLVVLFPEPYNPKAVAVASKHGMIIPNNHATQIDNRDFGRDTLCLVMNQPMKAKVYNTFDKAIIVYTIGEFSGDLEADVKDPYGKGVEEYDKCFTQLEGMLGKAAHNIKKALDDSAEKRKEEKYDSNWM